MLPRSKTKLLTRVHMEALIFVSIALSQTPADLKSTDYCIAWSACLAPSLRRYQFILLGELRHMCV